MLHDKTPARNTHLSPFALWQVSADGSGQTAFHSCIRQPPDSCGSCGGVFCSGLSGGHCHTVPLRARGRPAFRHSCGANPRRPKNFTEFFPDDVAFYSLPMTRAVRPVPGLAGFYGLAGIACAVAARHRALPLLQGGFSGPLGCPQPAYTFRVHAARLCFFAHGCGSVAAILL